MKGRDERAWFALHRGWLDGTEAVALVEGVIMGDIRRLGRGFSPSEGLALRQRHWGHEHCSERWLEGTRIKNKDTGTIATKLGPIAVLANA